jgi:ferredoxin
VSDPQKRVIAGLTVIIDRAICVGFEDCITASPPGTLYLDEDGVAAFTEVADGMTREQVLAAARSCPVDAIAVIEDGKQIAP